MLKRIVVSAVCLQLFISPLLAEDESDAWFGTRYAMTPSRTERVSRRRTVRWSGMLGRPALKHLKQYADIRGSKWSFDGYVYGVAWSPDGRWFVSGSHDKTVRVWDAGLLSQRQVLTGHGKAGPVAVSPDGQWIASGDEGGEVRLWKAGGKLVRKWSHPDKIGDLLFSPDSKRLVVGARVDKQAIRVHDLATGKQVRVMAVGEIAKLTWSPDGKRLLAGQESGSAFLLDPGTGKLLRTFKQLRGRTVGFCGAGTLIGGTYTYDKSYNRTNHLTRWKADGTGKPERLFSYEGDYNMADQAAVSSDGKRLAVLVHEQPGGDSVSWRLEGWTLAPARRVWKIPFERANAMAFSADGKRLLMGMHSGALTLIDSAIGKRLSGGTHDGTVNWLAPHPDGKRLASTGEDGTVRLWDLASGKQLRIERAGVNMHQAAFSVDGARLAAAGGDPFQGRSQLLVIDVVSWKPLLSEDEEFEASFSIAFTPDGKRLLAGQLVEAMDDGSAIEVVDISGKKSTGRIEGHNGGVIALRYLGGRLLTADHAGKVVLRDAKTHKPLFTVQLGKRVLGHAFSADGKTFAAGCKDGWIRTVSVAAGKPAARRFARHGAAVRAVGFSADGRWLYSVGADQRLRVWHRITGQLDDIIAVPDPRSLAVAGGRVYVGTKGGEIRAFTRGRSKHERYRRPRIGIATEVVEGNNGNRVDRIARQEVARAGLRVGDVIVRIGSVETPGLRQLDLAMWHLAPGQTVPFVVERAGKRLTLQIPLVSLD